jgi:hypothetical protein
VVASSSGVRRAAQLHVRPLLARFRDWVSFDYAAAVVVVALVVFVPIKAYVYYRSVYGELAELKLFVFGGLGMSAAFSLFVGQGRRLLALVPGFVGGVSGVALYLHMPSPALIMKGGFLVGRPSSCWHDPGHWLFCRLRGVTL